MSALVCELADQVERICSSHAACTWSLRIDSCLPHERRAAIDQHAAVMGELRRRGYVVRAGVDHLDGGEFLALRITGLQND